MIIPHLRHFKNSEQMTWTHHRSGWGYVINNIMEALSSDKGHVQFEGFVDGFFRSNQTIIGPWVGVVHNTPHHPSIVTERYPTVLDLTTLVALPLFKKSLRTCRGLYVLSDYCKRYLEPLVDVPVEKLHHPTQFESPVFSFEEFKNNQDKKVLSIGHWLRNFESFGKLQSPYRKVLIRPYKLVPIPGVSGIDTIDWVDHDIYDNLLQSNIVFADLYDSSANNVIIECIVRNTPILVNKLEAVQEYLGQDYPYYFTDLEDASRKLADVDLIEQTTTYLSKMNKSTLTIEHFISSIISGSLYNKL